MIGEVLFSLVDKDLLLFCPPLFALFVMFFAFSSAEPSILPIAFDYFLYNLEISDLAKLLRSKGTSNVPSPKNINWYKLKQDFGSFVNKLRKHYQSQFITKKTKMKNT